MLATIHKSKVPAPSDMSSPSGFSTAPKLPGPPVRRGDAATEHEGTTLRPARGTRKEPAKPRASRVGWSSENGDVLAMIEKAETSFKYRRELIDTYVLETDRVLGDFDEDLDDLAGVQPAPDILERLRMGIVVLNGTSGVLGFPRTNSLTELGRMLVQELEVGDRQLTEEITQTLRALSYALHEFVDDVRETGRERNRPHLVLRSNLARQPDGVDRGIDLPPAGEGAR